MATLLFITFGESDHFFYHFRLAPVYYIPCPAPVNYIKSTKNSCQCQYFERYCYSNPSLAEICEISEIVQNFSAVGIGFA